MGVQRQVVGGEGDVGVEQELQPALEGGVDRPGPEPQKSPWWTIRSSAPAAAASSNSSRCAETPVAMVLDLGRARDLQAVGP